MSFQTELNNVLLNFQIKSVDLIKSSVHSPKSPISEPQVFSFNVSLEQKVDSNNKCLIVVTHVEVSTVEDMDYKLASCSVACLYSIANYSDIVKVSDNNVSINESSLVILNSIALSTTRGVLSQLFRGTNLQHAVLPAIDPKAVRRS